MKLRMLLLAVLVPSFAWSQGGRPVRIEPGSDHLVAGRVPVGIDTLVITEGDDRAPRSAGILYLETFREARNGVDVLTRIEWMRGDGDRHVVADSFVLVQSGLAPLFASPLLEAGRDRVWFGASDVVHGPLRGGVARVPRAGAAFYGNSIDFVLRSLPLRQGVEAVVPLYEVGAKATSDAGVAVEALEDVRGASGETCRAWRIQVDSPEHGGTYWIDSTSFRMVRYRPPSEPFHLLRTGCGATSAPP